MTTNRVQWIKQHIIKDKKRSYCGLHCKYKHLTYHPKQGDSIKSMRDQLVCVSCIAYSDTDYNYKS